MKGKSFSDGVGGIVIVRKEGEGTTLLLRAEGKAVLSSAWLLRKTDGHPHPQQCGENAAARTQGSGQWFPESASAELGSRGKDAWARACWLALKTQ